MDASTQSPAGAAALPAPISHLAPEVLAAYGSGRLASEVVSVIEEHLGECETCGTRLDEFFPDRFASLLRNAASVGSDCSAHAPTAAFASDATAINLDAIPPELAAHSRYRLGELLGRGGMGAVYKAEHTLMERPVAVKVIAPQLLEHPGAADRFKQEVKAAARLRHTNIVTAYDAEEVGPVTVLVMEFVEGRSLADVLDERGPLPVHEACGYALQAAQGLAHAHALGMVHRDVKPHNLMLAADGCVKILDFGLARFVSEGLVESVTEEVAVADSMTAGLTKTGVVMGTLDYMAPEQARDAHAADARADVYALGATLYHLLTGRVPFPGGNGVDKLARLGSEDPAPLLDLRPDLPPELAAVVARLMAKRPEDRPSDAAEAAALLAPFASKSEPVRRSRRKWWTALAALVLVVGVVAYAIIKVPTEQGEVVIETDAPDIEVVVKGDRIVRIRDPKTGREYALDRQNLTFGESDGDGLQVTLDGNKPIVLKRNGQKFATVRLVPNTGSVSEVRTYREGLEGFAWRPRVGFARNGTEVFATTYGQDPRVIAWDRDSGRHVRTHTMGGNGFDMCLSADGKHCVLVNKQKRLELREFDTGRVVRDFPKGPTTKIWAVALSADGNRLAAAGDDGFVHVLRVGDGELLWKQDCRVKPVRALAISADGSRVATGGRGTALTLWDGATGQRLKQLGQPDCWCCEFTSGGERIIAAGSGEVELRDVVSGERIGRWVQKPNVECVTLATDGKRFATGAFDGTIRLWDIGREEPLVSFDAHHESALWVAFAPDGSHLASSGKDGAVRLWRIPDRFGPTPAAAVIPKIKPVSVIPPTLTEFGHGAPPAFGLAVSPDGRLAVTSGGQEPHPGKPQRIMRVMKDVELRLWDLATGREIGRLGRSLGHADTVAFSPNGKRVAAAVGGTFTNPDEYRIRVWDVETRQEVLALAGHTAGPPAGVAWSPDGARIASAAWDKTIRVWDATTGQELSRLGEGITTWGRVAFSPDGRSVFGGGYGSSAGWGRAGRFPLDGSKEFREFGIDGVNLGHINGIAVSSDGEIVATASLDASFHSVWLWDARSGRRLGQATTHLDGVMSVAFTPDDKFVVSTGWDRTVRISRRDSDAGRRVFDLPSPGLSVAVTPDGKHALVGCLDRVIRVIDITEPPLPTELTPRWVLTDQKNPRSLAATPDGRHLYSSGYDKSIRVWDLATGKETLRVAEGTDPFDALALSPDGSRLLVTHHDRSVRLWDPKTSEPLQKMTGHTNIVACVAISSNGKRALSGGHDSTVRLWDSENGNELKVLRGHTGPVRAVVFLPGNKAASGAHDGTVRIWDLDTALTLKSFGPFTNYVLSLAAFPDGKRLVANGGDAAAVLDIESKLVTRWFHGHSQKLHAVAVSPDGRLLATGGYDRTVRVWESGTGRCVAIARGFSEYVISVAFAGNDTLAAAGDNTIRVWDLPRPTAPMPRTMNTK